MPPDRLEGSLSANGATDGQRRIAAGVALVSVAFFAAAVPFAKMPLPPVGAFIPIYECALVVCDLVTAALLLAQLRFLRSTGHLVLACGYVLTALLATAHALTFPGLFTPTGLLGAGPQTTAWLYMFWHASFPFFVVAYAMAKSEVRTRAGAMWAVCATVWVALAFTAIATVEHDRLPAIMSGNRYTPVMTTVVSVTWLASVAALVVLWRRRAQTSLDLCLMLVMLAWTFDIALAAVLNAGRFDLGFYAGRVYGLAAVGIVLVMLLVENGRLYARLRERTSEAETARGEAVRAERTKSMFLATVSHEIRTPMNGVMGMLELLALTRLDKEQRSNLEVVRTSGRQLLRIVDDILDLSRIEAGKLDLRPEPASVPAVVTAVCDVHSGNASAKGLLLERSIDARLDRTVLIDAGRLQQILGNLINNAVKFTDSGCVSVRADLVQRAADHDIVRFAVRDTGVGISEEDIGKLFTPFAQTGPKPSGGTGLGLSISNRLAQAMGGNLKMTSTPGMGTSVELTLRLPIASTPPTQDVSEPVIDRPGERGTLSAVRRARVLAVDDHPVNRLLLERQLEQLGYATCTAADGAAALEQWAREQFDVIVTDCNMPKMNGYELAARIREIEASRGDRRIPIVALTANAMASERETCLQAGMDDYLAKPVSLPLLSAMLRRWIPTGPIEEVALDDLTTGNAEFRRAVLMEFSRTNEEDVRALKRAFARRDHAAIAHEAHRIKSASRAIGAEDLADVCEALEGAGRAADWAAIGSTMIGVEREVQRLHLHLKTL